MFKQNQTSKTSEKTVLWTLLILFFGLRIIYVLIYGVFDKSLFIDENGYNSYALEILKDWSWLNRTNFIASFREPLYPIFISIIYYIFGKENFLAVYIIQCLLSTLTLYYIYQISKLAFDNKSVAILALIWGGLYIFYLRYIGVLLRETLTYFLVSLLFYKFLILFRDRVFSIKKIIILSVIYFLLIHLDGRYIFYSPFLFILFYWSSGNILNSIRRYLIFALFVVLLTVPWTVRNYLVYGDVIVVSKYTLNLTGKKKSERSELFATSEIDSAYKTIHFTYNRQYPTEKERQMIKEGKNPNKRCKGEIELILKNKYPSKTFIGRKWYFIKSMWKPFDFTYNYAPFPMAFFNGPWSLKHNVLSIIFYGSLIPFFILGIIVSIKKRIFSVYLLLLPILVHFILHTITFGIERYRHPIDAFIIIIGCFGVIYTYNVVKEKFTK